MNISRNIHQLLSFNILTNIVNSKRNFTYSDQKLKKYLKTIMIINLNCLNDLSINLQKNPVNALKN
ncbi:hypothetical protein BpHYR1_004770 [Brachionus plicatilis]|uniref:Uncharacterized protein n=1 Tax=Brachionus plicatilis TaxID=10195 RepID=A0A3M7SZU8_BRAPC|nr:hypothetical protein BpHYR1_004770 [Brachionus plicatilis]